MYDGRIGRWLSVDPMGQYASPYAGMGNDPVNGFDPTGGKTTDWYKHAETGALIWRAGNAASIDIAGQTYQNVGTTFAYTVQNNSFIGNAEGTSTFLSPNEYNMVRFPESGSGFARYTNNGNDFYNLNGVRGQHGDNWADPTTAVNFYNAIQKFHKDEPGITIHYGDISAYDPSINLGHRTHNAGNSIDIRYFDEVGNELQGNLSYSQGDICLVNEFISDAVHFGFRSNYTYGSRFTHVGNNHHIVHNNHFHIGR